MVFPAYPFEASGEELEANIEHYVDGFISSLQSFFMVMPRGSGFVSLARFEEAYETLKQATADFENLSVEAAISALQRNPLVLVVLRAILGFSPPELAYVATATGAIPVDQSSSRRLDKRARQGQSLLLGTSPKTRRQVEALVRAAVDLILRGPPEVGEQVVHRLDKVDTRDGIGGIRRLAQTGVPYAALLYERFLGRPFASHRDAVSERVGDVLEAREFGS